MPPADAEIRALDLFERLLAYPGNARFRARLLKREGPDVMARLARIEAGDAARAAMPTTSPDWQAGPAPEPPARIGPFRLAERIGEGGMGDVWRGERDDGLFDQIVAIKLIRRDLIGSATAAFERERRILAKLDHPDIVRLTDGGVTDDGLPYLIMDHVDGAPFDEAVAALPIDQRIRLFRKVAAIVQFAHGRLIAHADLKPSNILVDRTGRIRLLDFGIAGLLQGDAETPSMAMTREFASPARRAGAPPSVADDVYALGRMLALTAAGDGDADLAAIIARAAADDETDRYDTVAALADDLERWQSGLPVAASSGGVAYRIRKFVARHRLGVAASAFAALLVLATTAIAVASAIRAEHQRRYAAARYADAHGIAKYLMFDVMDRMVDQPRSLAVRVDMANTAQRYLDQLARDTNADPAIRLDTATGFWRLAQYQSRSGHPNLAQTQAARANLHTAWALAASLPGRPAAMLRANILLDRASIADGADNDLPLAERLLARARPLVSGGDPLLAQAYQYEVAVLRSWQGRYAEEKAAAATGLALPAVADTRRGYAVRDALLDIYTDFFFNVRDYRSALDVSVREVDLGEAARRRWPADHMIASRLMYARLNQGMMLNALDRLPEALVVLRQASREAQAQVAFEPADRWTNAQQFSIETTRAQTLAFLGRTDEALAIYDDWATRKRIAWEAHPREVSLFRAYVQVRAMIGEAQSRAHRTADQCRTDGETLRLYQRLKALGALTRWDEDNNLAQLQQRFTDRCASLGG